MELNILIRYGKKYETNIKYLYVVTNYVNFVVKRLFIQEHEIK